MLPSSANGRLACVTIAAAAAIAQPESARAAEVLVVGQSVAVRAAAVPAAAHSSATPRQLAGTRIPAADLTAFAHQALLRAMASQPGHIEAQWVGRHRDIELSRGEWKLHSRVSAERIRSRMCVWVDVLMDGRVVRSIPVTFDVRWMRPALVTREPLAAKLALDPSRVTLVETDAAISHGEPIADPAQLQGKRLRRELPANVPLGADDLEDLPPVAAGDKVDVYAKVGGVVVRTVGVAQRDGFSGDRINVRLEGRPQSLRVQVVGENLTSVIENANSKTFE